MPAGRPPKYETSESTESLASRGYTKADQYEIDRAFPTDSRFKTESEMCAVIESNMEEFVSEIDQEAELLSFRKEYNGNFGIGKGGQSGLRVDFRVLTTKGKWLIEVKNPRNTYSELRIGVAQCLDYLTRFDADMAILVSSRFSDVVPRLINAYDLPIKFVLFNRDGIAIMGDSENG